MPARTYARITDCPIDPSALLARVGADSNGAKLLFVGVVRDHADGKRVTGITYHAYKEMAEKVLEQIVRDAAEELGKGNVAAAHRTGELSMGEASVAIAVASPHRAEAYRASRRVIEEIKARLPVWKHESYVSGTREWVRGVDPVTLDPTSRPQTPDTTPQAPGTTRSSPMATG